MNKRAVDFFEGQKSSEYGPVLETFPDIENTPFGGGNGTTREGSVGV